MANDKSTTIGGTPEASKILTKPLPQILEEMGESIRKAAEDARRAAELAAEAAARKADEARKSAEDAAKKAQEASQIVAREAERKAEEALKKADEALPANLVRKMLASWEFLTILILVFLGAVFAAVSISLGLALMKP